MTEARKPRGPKRSKKTQLRDLLEADVPLPEAIAMVGYKSTKRELRRLTGVLANIEKGDLTAVARKKLRDIIRAGAAEAVIAAAKELLKRLPASSGTSGTVMVELVEMGMPLDKCFMPRDPKFATTVAEVLALIDSFAGGNTAHEDPDAAADRDICERALAKILADEHVRDTTIVSACREILSTLVGTPQGAAKSERFLGIQVANGRGPLQPHTIFLRGVKCRDVFDELSARDAQAA